MRRGISKNKIYRRSLVGILISHTVFFGVVQSLSFPAVLDAARIARMQKDEKRPQVSFSHVHLYVDELKDLNIYKDLEDRLNRFVNACDIPLGQDIPTQQALWENKYQPDYFDLPSKSAAFVPQNRDLVQQLLSGFGFRITGFRYPDDTSSCNTRSLLVTSKDPSGVQFVLTAKDSNAPLSAGNECRDPYHHFDQQCLDRFFASHAGRPGIAVLAFLVEDVDIIRQRFQEKHPNLLVGFWEYSEDQVKMLEVYAYYDGSSESKDKNSRQADKGTILRFIQDNRQGAGEDADSLCCAVPGLKACAAQYDRNTQPAYCDLWVSNGT